MTGPVAKVIAALTGQEHLTPAEIHKAVDRALWPDEPTAPGAIVVLYARPYRVDGSEVMEETKIFQYAPGSPMDSEANGFARWYDEKEEAYRAWPWICERDGKMRIFVQAEVTP